MKMFVRGLAPNPRCTECGHAKRGISPSGFRGLIYHCKNLACSRGFTLQVRSRMEMGR